MKAVTPLLAVGGGQAFVTWKPAKDTPQQSLDLAEAANSCFAELHPDSAIRIETFVTLADTSGEGENAVANRRQRQPNDLLATAISGWAMGKSGTTATPEAALKLWRARQLVLAHQGSNDPNARNDILGRYKKTSRWGRTNSLRSSRCFRRQTRKTSRTAPVSPSRWVKTPQVAFTVERLARLQAMPAVLTIS